MMANTTICTHPGLYNQDNIASLGLLVYCVAEHAYRQGVLVTGIEIMVGMFAYMIFASIGYSIILISIPILSIFKKPR